jgi:hypothetical protein
VDAIALQLRHSQEVFIANRQPPKTLQRYLALQFRQIHLQPTNRHLDRHLPQGCLAHKHLRARGLNPLQLDSPAPRLPLAQAMASENRFRQLQQSQPERAAALAAQAQQVVDRRWALYRALAALPVT